MWESCVRRWEEGRGVDLNFFSRCFELDEGRITTLMFSPVLENLMFYDSKFIIKSLMFYLLGLISA
jgi:hypothetical protein